MCIIIFWKHAHTLHIKNLTIKICKRSSCVLIQKLLHSIKRVFTENYSGGPLYGIGCFNPLYLIEGPFWNNLKIYGNCNSVYKL